MYAGWQPQCPQIALPTSPERRLLATPPPTQRRAGRLAKNTTPAWEAKWLGDYTKMYGCGYYSVQATAPVFTLHIRQGRWSCYKIWSCAQSSWPGGLLQIVGLREMARAWGGALLPAVDDTRPCPWRDKCVCRGDAHKDSSPVVVTSPALYRRRGCYTQHKHAKDRHSHCVGDASTRAWTPNVKRHAIRSTRDSVVLGVVWDQLCRCYLAQF